MDRNEYAIITNELGGIDATATELGIDADLLSDALSGNRLSRDESITIESAFNDFYNSENNNLDYDAVEKLAETLAEVTDFIGDYDLENRFVELIANGDVDLDYLENNATDLFADLNPVYADAVITWIEQGNDASTIFDAYLNDVDFWDINDSDFWDWFRDTFYGD